MQIPITAFTSNLTAATCGAFTYQATLSPTSPLDSSVYTFDAALIKLTIATSISAYSGQTHRVRITGT